MHPGVAMKMLLSFFVVFLITVVGTIGFMKPELLMNPELLLTGESEDTVMLTEAEAIELKRETAKARAKRSKRRSSANRARPEEDDFDDFMNGTPKDKMPSKILPAPSLDVSGWENSAPLSISSLRGKIVVLDFWARCGPCIDAIPHNDHLVQKYGNKGVVLIGVCTSKGTERMSRVAKENSIQYPIAKDINRKTGKSYKIKAYPRYCVIDANGNLRFEDLKKREVEAAIKYLLKE